MFCPRCGQEQISENTRFCSRCGFLLETVSEVLANGGVLPQLLELKGKKPFFTRRNGLIISVFWFMLFVLILTPFWGILDVDALAGMSAVIGVFGGLMWLIASLLLFKNTSGRFSPEPALPTAYQNLGGAAQNVLPPQQTQPVESYVAPANNWKAPNTGDLVRPASVTEETTKLLQKDK